VTLLAEIVRASERVASSSGRLAKARAIADVLRRVTHDEIEIAIPFLSGDTRQGRLALGNAALSSVRRLPAAGPTLTLADVDDSFRELKTANGKGAASRRRSVLEDLFGRATAEEQDFLVRLIAGELRQGALEGVMVEAVAVATEVPADEIRRAASFARGVVPVAQAALVEGAAGLERFSIRLMQPIGPMLAQPAADAESAIAALGEALVEWKLDGARVQVHKSGQEVRVYTRTLNDVTAVVPEVADAARAASAGSVILDGEAIALRPDGTPHPFQITMRRFGRKADDEAMRRELPLSVYFFDCMFADGVGLVDRPLKERRLALEQVMPAKHVMPSIRTADAGEAAAFYAAALQAGHEGIMAKAPDSAYEAGRRGGAWLKIKRAHTLDLVVLAAEWGHGRRRGWLSNLHLGAWDATSERFVMLGKTFKGLTDALLEWQTRQFLEREVARDEWGVQVRPELVVEVAFNGIQESSQYPGGMALRFARVKRYRPDKSAAQADTIEAVRRFYEGQNGA
jgi:DNA ligase-1